MRIRRAWLGPRQDAGRVLCRTASCGPRPSRRGRPEVVGERAPQTFWPRGPFYALRVGRAFHRPRRGSATEPRTQRALDGFGLAGGGSSANNGQGASEARLTPRLLHATWGGPWPWPSKDRPTRASRHESAETKAAARQRGCYKHRVETKKGVLQVAAAAITTSSKKTQLELIVLNRVNSPSGRLFSSTV